MRGRLGFWSSGQQERRGASQLGLLVGGNPVNAGGWMIGCLDGGKAGGLAGENASFRGGWMTGQREYRLLGGREGRWAGCRRRLDGWRRERGSLVAEWLVGGDASLRGRLAAWRAGRRGGGLPGEAGWLAGRREGADGCRGRLDGWIVSYASALRSAGFRCFRGF